MSEANNNEQIDADILQCKADILRARDIIPGTPKRNKKETDQEPKSQKRGDNTTRAADAAEISAVKEKTTPEAPSSIPIEPTPSKKTVPLPKPVVSVNKKEKAETLQEKPEIPRFDLAEEIMAEQRKITAIKRKAPGKKSKAEKAEPEAEPVGHIIEQPPPALPDQDRIIAEIVAKDIERLRRGDRSGARR